MSREIRLSSEDFGLKLYNRFPPQYREDDVLQNYALKRYLQACADGGFAYSIDEWNGILNIPDIATVDAKILPVLYAQYGFNLFHGIPEEYLRFLLPKLSEAWAKKGSIDVIEFVVSALSGIKTDTEVYDDDDGNPQLDVRLEMDYNMGTYFPDAVQFKRILEEFVPFYLQTTLIYAYVFYESQKLWLAETEFYDKVSELYPVSTFIPFAKGTRYAPTVNNIDYALNGTLITNVMRTFTEDPDSNFDGVTIDVVEERDILGVEETVHNFVSTNPVMDSSAFWGKDSRFDAVKTEDTFLYYPTLNTGLLLNVDIITNYGTEDRVELDAQEGWLADQCHLASISESQSVGHDTSNDQYQGLFLNTEESVLNDGCLIVPDIFDKITYRNIGVSVIAFPSMYSYAGAM